MSYIVEPGLYALHNPGPESPVLVAANYKLSFDHLRRELTGIDAWLLVLETDGINVWCAAGKGSFGSAELVRRFADSNLAKLVSHHRLIVPQLGAPGINARLVERATGFKVLFGPTMAADLPAYLAAGCRATAAMRRKFFPLTERAVLVPVELLLSLKWLLPLALLLLLLTMFGGVRAAIFTPWVGGALISAVLAGQLLTPLFLPWLPGRSFSGKGLLVGLLAAAGFLTFRYPAALAAAEIGPGPELELLAWPLLIAALASFLALEFTGSSTYTSLSGVKKELKLALPWQIGIGLSGLLLLLAGWFFS